MSISHWGIFPLDFLKGAWVPCGFETYLNRVNYEATRDAYMSERRRNFLDGK